MSKMHHIDNVQEIHMAAPIQSAMYHFSMLTGEMEVDPYFRQKRLMLSGSWEEAKAQLALERLTRRHDSLRSLFNHKKGKGVLMIVMKDWPTAFEWHDLRGMDSPQAQEEKIQSFQKEDALRGFDLKKDSLLRIAVFQLAEEEFVFILSYHHIIIDGWGADQLSKEFVQLYMGEVLPPVQQYGSYLKWLQQQDIHAARSYWREALAGYEELTELPNKVHSSSIQESYQRHEWAWSEAESEALRRLSSRYQVTVSTCLQAIWGILLSRYTGKRDVTVGVVVSGRPSTVRGVDEIVGIFINTLPLRLRHEEGMTFAQMVQQLQQQVYEREPFEYVSLTDVQEEVGIQRLFDHLMIFEHYAESDENPSSNSGQQDQVAQTEYDFLIAIDPRSPMRGYIDYRASAFDAETIAQMATHFQSLCHQVAANPTSKIDELQLLSQEEKAILDSYQPSQDIYSEEPIIPLLQKICTQKASEIAIVSESQQWTYQDVWTLSSRLAYRMEKEMGIEPGHAVGYLAETSPWTVVVLMAIWQLRAVYVPLRSDWPEKRLRQVLQDSQAKGLIRLGEGKEFLDQQLPLVICEGAEEWENPPATWSMPGLLAQGEDLAYMIYTSGTSGLPKGVMIKQESITDRILYHIDVLNIGNEDCVMQFSSLSFDASLVEILMALLGGVRLALPEAEVKQNLSRLVDFIEASQVSVAIFPPAVLQAFNKNELSSIRLIISTGEAAYLEESLYYAKHKEVWNGYGPTETCVGASFHQVSTHREDQYRQKGQIPIGKPFANTRIYVLNELQQLLPPGHIGEIWVAGVGLAKGYLNQPDETQARFRSQMVDLPHEDRLYRTGDLGRWTADGELEYIGRADGQVQIRGIRIEPQEVERVLASHPKVKQALIVVNKDKRQPQLWAYASGPAQDELPELKTYLAETLPTYMRPSQLMILEEFPLTAHGKINQKLLPKPSDLVEKGEGESLREGTETKLAQLWSEVLGKLINSPFANFFEEGGHSLKAMQLTSSIFDSWQVSLTVNDLFSFSQLRELADLIESRQKESSNMIPALEPQPDYPTSAAQQGIWMAYQQPAARVSYHVPLIHRLNGSVDIEAWKKAWKAILDRHESLRTTLSLEKEEVRQYVRTIDSVEDIWTYQDFSQRTDPEKEASEEIEALIEMPFDLGKDALLRVALIKLDEQAYMSLIVLHHIICDPGSMGILSRDFFTLYQEACSGQVAELPPLDIHYKDYVHWQIGQVNDRKYKTYWHTKLSGVKLGTAIPLDNSRPEIKAHKGEVLVIPMEDSLYQGLKALCEKEGVSFLMLFAAAVKLLLHRLTLSEDIVIGTTISGREHQQLKNQIGFFVNTLVLRSTIKRTSTVGEALRDVRKTLLEALQHQMYPFSYLVSELIPKRDRTRGAFFDVLLEYIPIGKESSQDISLPNLSIEALSKTQHYSKHDIAFRFLDYGEEMDCYYKFDPDLLNIESVQKYHNYLLQILTFMQESLDGTVAAIPLQDPNVSQAKGELVSGFDFQF